MDIKFTEEGEATYEFFYHDCGNIVYVKSYSLHEGKLILESECLNCEDDAYFFFTPNDLAGTEPDTKPSTAKPRTNNVVALDDFRDNSS